jgi:hypothetical protein
MTRIEGLSGQAITSPSAAQFLTEIGQAIDCELELLARSTSAGPVYLIAPVDRMRLRSVFWGLVRADPCAGVWKTPEAALVGFAIRCLGWAKAARRQSPREIEQFVVDQLGQAGNARAAQVRQAARIAGITGSALHRAALRLGVCKQKISMSEGWLWSLPTEDELKYSAGAKQ